MAYQHTIRRAFEPNIHVFRCEPCGAAVGEGEDQKR
jgi:hypothetical protein